MRMQQCKGLGKLLWIVAVVTMLMPGFAESRAARNDTVLAQTLEAQSGPKVYVNGQELHTDMPVLQKDRVLYIALGWSVAEALGADFSIGAAGKAYQVTLRKGDTTVTFTEGNTEYVVNGLPQDLFVKPFVQSGFLLVPLRPLFAVFGASVEWDKEKNVVRVGIGKAEMPPAVSRIPAEVFGGGAPEEEAPAAATEAVVTPIEAATETAVTGMEAEAESHRIEYTLDNTIGYQSVTVSGDRTQSSLISKSAFSNRFNIRFQGLMPNGYEMNSVLRTTETTDYQRKKGEVNKFSLSLEKERIALTLYDLFPKFSYYQLKNYQTQGVEYERTNNLFTWTAIWGKTPKRLRDSKYFRYLDGFRVHREKTDKSDIGIGYVRVKDTGPNQSTDRIENETYAMNGMLRVNENSKMIGEFSMSSTRIFKGKPTLGNARVLQYQYRDSRTTGTLNYERTGSGYNTETSFVTAGRREASALLNHKVSAKSLVGAGYKTVLLLGEETLSLPLLWTFSPLKSRSDMRLTIQRNFERARGSSDGTKITESREVALADKLGTAKLDLDVERRRQKSLSKGISFRTTQKFRLAQPLTKKLDMTLQYRRERRTQSTTPIMRQGQVTFMYEVKDWTDLVFGLERFYIGSTQDRTSLLVGLKKVDVENDREMSFEYHFYNYRDHNDNSLSLDYSFYR